MNLICLVFSVDCFAFSPVSSAQRQYAAKCHHFNGTVDSHLCFCIVIGASFQISFQAFVLIFVTLALNVQFQTLAPQYSSFGTQFYLAEHHVLIIFAFSI
jgi:hypothetical protein